MKTSNLICPDLGTTWNNHFQIAYQHSCPMASCHLPGHMQTLKAVDNSGSEGKTRLPRVTGWDEEEEAKAPENGPSQKETHLPTIHFQGQAVSFGEGILTTKFKDLQTLECRAFGVWGVCSKWLFWSKESQRYFSKSKTKPQDGPPSAKVYIGLELHLNKKNSYPFI